MTLTPRIWVTWVELTGSKARRNVIIIFESCFTLKLREAVIFFSKWEIGRVLQPDDLVLDETSVIDKTIAFVLAGGNPHEKIPTCSTVEAYDKTPVFISVGITEDVVKLVACKLLGGSSPGGTDLDALQGWLLKFWGGQKNT